MTAAALSEQQACRHHAGLSDGWLTSGILAVTAAFLTSIAPVPDAHAATPRPVDGKALISAADDLEDWLSRQRDRSMRVPTPVPADDIALRLIA